MKIAYIFGVTGSGKGHAVKLLEQGLKFKCIEIDSFRRTLLRHVVPYFQSHARGTKTSSTKKRVIFVA